MKNISIRNRKGFTLIELIATIALLAVIFVICFVSINAVIENNKVSDCETLVNNITIASKEYVSDNRYNSEFNLSNSKNLSFNGKVLIDNNYLNGEIYDPFSDKVMDSTKIQIYVNLNNDYTVSMVKVFYDGAPYTCGTNKSDDITDDELVGGAVRIKGSTVVGETLTTEITDTIPKADSYTYQWYVNTNNSTNGGTLISGATNSTLNLIEDYVGKYIYVVVTANKVGYDSVTFSDVTGPVVINGAYIINYNANGGSGTMRANVCETGKECFVSENAFTRDGYIFVGWTTNGDGSDDGYNWTGWSGKWIYQNGERGIENNTLTLYAMWTKYTVTIRYSVNGGNITSNTGGYTWSTDSNGIINVNYSGNTISEYTTTILYGNSTDSNALVNWDNPNFIEITKNGYSALDGAEWKCLSGNCAKTTYSDSTTYTASDFCDASNGDCTVTLGVNWVGNAYTITYVTNGGYGPVATDGSNDKYCTYVSTGNHDVTGMMESQTCRYGDVCTLTKNAFVRTCHQFMGWTTRTDTDTMLYIDVGYKNSADSRKFISGKYTYVDYDSSDTDEFYADGDEFVYNVIGDITLYAVWKNNHNWKASGVQLFSTSGKFACGNYHTKGYGVYCTECQMSSSHYNYCYMSSYEKTESTKYCPCNDQMKFNDSAVFNKNGSQLTVLNDAELRKYGGLIEGKSSFTKNPTVLNACDH